MGRGNKAKKEITKEIEELRARLEETEEALRAIRSGEVDALVVYGEDGEQIFTLQGAEHPYRIMVETMNEGAATLRDDGVILYCNRHLASMLKMPLENMIGVPLLRFVIPDDISIFEALLEGGREGSNKGEVTFQCDDGTLVPVQLSMSVLRVNTEIRGVCVVVTDLTEQKRNEEIIASEQLARSILDQIAEAIVVCDFEGRIIRASQTAHLLCGRNPLFQPFEMVFPLRFEDKEQNGRGFSFAAVLRGEVFKQVEAHLERNFSASQEGEGQAINLLVSTAPLRDTQNKIVGCVISLTDITDRKQAEEQIKSSLSEKEVLLKEIHHRVKNNLQIVSSLLNLQSRSVTDKQAREKFKESRDRIRSMALIHEKLYQSRDLVGISLREYIKSLTSHLFRSYSANPNIKLNIDVDNVLVNIDKAISCGLIINELVSNALKHAFTEKKEGEVRIRLHLNNDKGDSENLCTLTVSNNGSPFPEDFDFLNSQSLGLQLVCALTDQLRGTIELDRSGGTEFKIAFCI
ncbi:MAG TPA: histidine kinase dimerization/phosphoacceptor domain -containing protein [Thermodesulfobacteriota bacterium]|nr:histidine kinase dimerization/phosphoacceptor domain -containing protein [Thermodesulfobacteriota bacterium]